MVEKEYKLAETRKWGQKEVRRFAKTFIRPNSTPFEFMPAFEVEAERRDRDKMLETMKLYLANFCGDLACEKTCANEDCLIRATKDILERVLELDGWKK